MMSDHQDFCLRWSSYTQQLSEALRTLLDRELLVDVTLACDGRSIKAHRAVLSACSTYFQDLFQESTHPHPIVILKDVRFEELEALVRFMYHGEVTVNHDTLQGFLQTAETLHIRGLTDGVHSGQIGTSLKEDNQAEPLLSDRDEDSVAEGDIHPTPKRIKLEPSSESSYLHQEIDHDGSNEGTLPHSELQETRSMGRSDEVSPCNVDQFKVQQTITTLDGLSQLVMPHTQEDDSSHYIGVQPAQSGSQIRSLSLGGPGHLSPAQMHGQIGVPNNGSGRPFRQRVLYNQEQLLQLESWYRQDRYPCGARMKEYAEKLATMAPQSPGNIGVQPMRQNVDYWFQNRRRKDFHPEVMQQREKKKLAKALWGSYTGSQANSAPSTSSNNSSITPAENSSAEK